MNCSKNDSCLNDSFVFPALDLLKVYDNETMPVIDQDEQRANGTRIVTALRHYGISVPSVERYLSMDNAQLWLHSLYGNRFERQFPLSKPLYLLEWRIPRRQKSH